jgi:hypothetical protein
MRGLFDLSLFALPFFDFLLIITPPLTNPLQISIRRQRNQQHMFDALVDLETNRAPTAPCCRGRCGMVETMILPFSKKCTVRGEKTALIRIDMRSSNKRWFIQPRDCLYFTDMPSAIE